jgi:hypothetical protein
MTHALHARSRLFLVVLGVLLAACGRAPVPLDSAPAAPAGEAMPQDDIHSGLQRRMPEDNVHTGLQASQNPHQAAGGESESFQGVVRLRGELASRDQAFLFISVMPRGSNRPLGSTKVPLADAALGTLQDGERTISFTLETVAKIADPVELQVWFDLDGNVDSKEEGSLIRRFPIEHAASAIDVVLDPSAE